MYILGVYVASLTTEGQGSNPFLSRAREIIGLKGEPATVIMLKRYKSTPNNLYPHIDASLILQRSFF